MGQSSAKLAPSETTVLSLETAGALEARSALRRQRITRLTILWEYRRSLLKACLGGAAFATLIAFLIPERFVSTARLMPPDSSSGQGMAIASMLASRAGSLGTLGSEFFGLKTSGDLFMGVLVSRTVEDEIIKKFDLRKVYGERRAEDARKELARRTDVSVNRKSGIITLEVIDHDPNRAMAIATEYIAQLNRVVTALNTSSAHRERVFLEERLQQVKTELTAAEKDFSQFASKNTAIDIKEQGKAMMEAAAMLEGQLIAAQTELQGLRQIYSDQNFRTRAMQARVNELRAQLRKLGGVDGSPSGEGSSSELYPSIRKLPLLGVAYADLYRRTKVQEIVFETLTQQYEMAKVQEAKEVPSVKVLDAPDVPDKKVFPPRLLIVALAACAAFAACVMWIFAKSRWDALEPEDPGRLLALNVYASFRRVPAAAQAAARTTVGPKGFLERFRVARRPANDRL
jgi:capsule polysaccharide export protein KpsE/RkpR